MNLWHYLNMALFPTPIRRGKALVVVEYLWARYSTCVQGGDHALRRELEGFGVVAPLAVAWLRPWCVESARPLITPGMPGTSNWIAMKMQQACVRLQFIVCATYATKERHKVVSGGLGNAPSDMDAITIVGRQP